MKKFRSTFAMVATAILALVGALMVPASAQALGQYPSGTVGVDNSYPSCHAKIPTNESFAVVGVSGGSTYTDDPCAAKLASNYKNVSYYVNTGLYTGSVHFGPAMTYGNCASGDYACGAYWYGYLAGQHAYNYATSQGIGATPTTWWLDVEETNTWDSNLAWNVQSIQGEYDGLNSLVPAGSTIGIYAVRSQWDLIVGSYWPNDGTHAYPVWSANGLTSSAAVSSYCTSTAASVTGGPVQIVQWVGAKKQDYDYAC